MSQELKRVEQNGYDDEIDLMELIMILVREKKTILITFIIVTLLSLGGALYERNVSKKAVAIINLGFNAKNFNQNDLLLSNVLDKVYQLNDIRQKNKLSLDEFRDEFKIEGIIPKAIEDKKEFLAKSGQVLEYTPQNYSVQLRVGSPSESKKILEDYYVALNDH
ncbi:MAG: Wzz/FepE/Etk N-terminal domain-containing protein, partial [Cetobacterium sp.]